MAVETSPSPPTGPTDCVIGSLGCSCGESAGCALDPDGEPLYVRGGRVPPADVPERQPRLRLQERRVQ
ncbi:MAG: hypothetical protein U1F43_32530 [Myxococcota bacterium]